jgi:murein DD-endopeptidase MepM/ murein hydrolase activator NlpD
MASRFGASLFLAALIAFSSQSAEAISIDRTPDHTTRAQAVDQVHVPPVSAPVIDPFRPPDQPWLSGNRGIEYGTQPGDLISASARGVVTFAGQVGGNLFVTIRHTDTLVTTVGFVASATVATGDIVAQGTPIAVAAGPIHFTARRNGRYIDPASLFVRMRIIVRLVAGVT